MVVVPLRERARHGENRQFIDQLRNFLALDDRAFERRAGDFHRPARLDLIHILDRFAHLRAHANQNREESGAGVVQTAPPNQ